MRSTALIDHKTAVAIRAKSATESIGCIGEESSAVPVSGDSIFYAASLTKQFIGVLVAMSVDGGVMTPENSIREFLPELPLLADGITLSHLLHHTSGLPIDSQGRDNAGVVDWLAREVAPEYSRGLAFQYSNVGYICLAVALERAGGNPIAELARTRLFEPLGMMNSSLGGRPAGAIASNSEVPLTIGDGGLWTSVRDLSRWNDAMNTRFFGQNVNDLIESTGTLNDGTSLAYAFGIGVNERMGHKTITHGGRVIGWSGKTVRIPDLGIGVALLTTCDDIPTVSSAGLAIADWLMA
ncbi:MAG: serine hydrolase domain-containing protein [Candidatus Dormibacteria bacterium]